MRFTSPSRRAAGLMAATTIGLSTAVLSVTGIASAAPVTTTTTFSSDETADADQAGGVLSAEGDCTIRWDIVGAAGGAGYTGTTPTAGGLGGHYVATTTSTGSAVFILRAGVKGQDAVVGYKAGAGGYNGAGDVWPSSGTGGLESPGAIVDPSDPAVASDDVKGGGGGAASVVYTYDVDTEGKQRYLGAFGGNGGLAADPNGLGGLGGVNVDLSGATDVEPKAPSGTGDGLISGSMTCSVAEDPNTPVGPDSDEEEQVIDAPSANWVYGVDNGLAFQLRVSAPSSANPVKGVEYTLDGGATWSAVGAIPGTIPDTITGTITGLETGAKYSVAFRFTTATGHTEASATLVGRTAAPGPQDVTAVAGPGSIKVSWAAPASMRDVSGYLATATPADTDGSAGSIGCQPTTALGTSCAMAAVPGTTYRLDVASADADGEWIGSSDFITVGPIPDSTVAGALPKADGTLTSNDADGKVVAGDKITISGKDFLPGSTVDLVVYSTPVELGTATVLADGTFSATVVLPKELANGTHHLVASGVDANGNPRNLVVEVTVSGGTAVLAFTGFSALPFVGAGALALIAGGGLLVVSRRRQAA